MRSLQFLACLAAGSVVFACSSVLQDVGDNEVDPEHQEDEVRKDGGGEGGDGFVDGASTVDGSSVVGKWRAVSTVDAPEGREAHSAVWTGQEMIVWGGFSKDHYVQTGARYNPQTNTWTALPLEGAPSGRAGHRAVWTGTDMIVWGGYSQAHGYQYTGRRYNVATNTWYGMSTAGGPSARRDHAAVWTGSEMIVWGGKGDKGFSWDNARYHPASDMWNPISRLEDSPGRDGFSTIWTGQEMMVWGGDRNPGEDTNIGRYSPSADTWDVFLDDRWDEEQPSERLLHTAVWTGSRMIVWGGETRADYELLRNGGAYDPVKKVWTELSAVEAPSKRCEHTAVWTGSQMIVWGGNNVDENFNTGGTYEPSSDTWKSLPVQGAPSKRSQHTAIWTGSEMLIWGGFEDSEDLDAGDDRWRHTNTGALYRP